MLFSLLILAVLLVIVMGGVIYWFFFREEEGDKKNVSLSPVVNVSSKASVIFLEGLAGIQITHPVIRHIKETIHQHIVGMDGFVNGVLLSLLAGKHLLVEGAPGLAKTKTITLLARLTGLRFNRLQCTPDMMPSDVVGIEMYNPQTQQFELRYGPVMTNILLADEINRTTPKVQSALLESMEEHQVSLGGVTKKLPDPFLVLATQNPIEHQGTYSLPEAQLDRFLCKVLVHYPTQQEEEKILQCSPSIDVESVVSLEEIQWYQQEIEQIQISNAMIRYITTLVAKTREPHKYTQYGASPRASLGLQQAAKVVAFLAQRDRVHKEDIQRIFLSIVRHRIVMKHTAHIDGVDSDNVLLSIVSTY